jgi:hypothetical protein
MGIGKKAERLHKFGVGRERERVEVGVKNADRNNRNSSKKSKREKGRVEWSGN